MSTKNSLFSLNTLASIFGLASQEVSIEQSKERFAKKWRKKPNQVVIARAQRWRGRGVLARMASYENIPQHGN